MKTPAVLPAAQRNEPAMISQGPLLLVSVKPVPKIVS